MARINASASISRRPEHPVEPVDEQVELLWGKLIDPAETAVALRHDMPDRWPLDLIDGFAMGVAGRQYRTICRIGSPLIASAFRAGI